MNNTVIATFTDAQDAEKAAGALLDLGVRDEDLSLVRHHVDSTEPVDEQVKDRLQPEHAAKSGLSTTTAGDAAIGAEKGAGWGLGLGILAGLASVFIPGVGLVLGGGALAVAIGGAAATTGAGAVAGAVTGYLREQGYEPKDEARYEEVIRGGGAILSVALPSNDIGEAQFWETVNKYQGVPLRSTVVTDRTYLG